MGSMPIAEVGAAGGAAAAGVAMRILHYMQLVDFRFGGPPRAVVELASVLRGRGHEVTLATTLDRDVPKHEDAPGLRVVRMPPVSRLRRLPAESVRIFRGLLGDHEIVHMHGVWEPGNLQLAAACRKAGVPYVVSLRGMLDDWAMGQGPFKKRLYLRLGGRRYLESAAAVHCTAAGEMAQAQRHFGRARGVVVPNLIDLAPYAAAPDPAEARSRWPALAGEGLKVLFLSRLHASKGLPILIDAVAAARRRGQAVHLAVAGTGDAAYEEAMRRRVEAAGLAGHCTFTGFVDGGLKRSLYAASDLFALPTSQENFGFVLFESIAAGTAVATTDQVDTREELARSGGAVILPQTVEAFTEAIGEFAAGRRDAAAMGRAGRAWALEELDTSRVAARFESLYESCLRGR